MAWVAVAVAGGTALISGIGKKVASDNLVDQQKEALKNLKESNFISPALMQALGNAEKRKDATMYAGQEVDQANINRNAAQAFSNLSRGTKSSTNLVNGTMSIQGQQNIAAQGLQRNLALYKDQANRDFTSLLLQKANAQMGNKRQYEASKSALQGAIMQNQAQGDNALWNSFGQIGGGILGGVASGAFGGQKPSQPSQSNPFYDWAGANGY